MTKKKEGDEVADKKANGGAESATPATKKSSSARGAGAKKIEEVDATRKSTQAARTAGAEEGRKQRAEYFALKKFVIEREEENFSKLMIVHEKDDWWKIFGHSAIMFAYEVSNWLGMDVKLRPDSDYDHKSKDGVVIIHDVYALDKKLAKAKVNLLKSTDAYRVYNLGKKFSESDIERMRNREALEWERVNSIITVRDVFPDLHSAMREMIAYYYSAVRRFEPFARDEFAVPIVEKMTELLRNYNLCCNAGTLADSDYLKDVTEAMHWIKAQIDIIAELKLLEVKKIYQLLKKADRIERLSEQCRQRRV